MQIGDVIARKGGVVSAEELAPYLDVPAYSEDNKVILLLFYALWVPSVYFLLSWITLTCALVSHVAITFICAKDRSSANVEVWWSMAGWWGICVASTAAFWGSPWGWSAGNLIIFWWMIWTLDDIFNVERIAVCCLFLSYLYAKISSM